MLYSAAATSHRYLTKQEGAQPLLRAPQRERVRAPQTHTHTSVLHTARPSSSVTGILTSERGRRYVTARAWGANASYHPLGSGEAC